MTRLGIDVSNWTGDISAAKVEELKAAGVEYAIVGTQTSANGDRPAPRQIAALEAGGIEVPAMYCFLYWDERDEARVKDAATFGKPIWLDCEYVKHPMPAPQYISTYILQATDVAAHYGLLAGIYTGSWWWLPYTNHSVEFKDLPLWHAAYQARPESLHLPSPYGGWDKAAIWQYSSGGIAGVNADLNVMEDAPVPDPTPTPPAQPTEIQALRALVRAGSIITAGDQNLEDLKPEDKDALDWIAATARG